MKHILLMYGHALSQCALRALLHKEPSTQLVVEVNSVPQALAYLRQQAVDIIMLDVSATEINGLEVFCDLKQALPAQAILIINGSEHPGRIQHFIRLGCAAYIPYTADSTQVALAVKTVGRGQRYLLPQHQPLLSAQPPLPHDSLSLRELQVFFKLIKGQAINAVASELDIAPGSVSVFRSKLLRKMRVTNNAALIQYALQHHLILTQGSQASGGAQPFVAPAAVS